MRVFFVDDNLIGNRPACKKLLQFLKEYQDKHNYRFSFGTEASLNMAADTELLQLFRDAGFGWVFIGIESPDPASLKETLKTQNMNQDILGSIARIYSFGIEVLAGFIIGFDNDTMETFEAQYKFITASGIQAAMVGLLHALPKTPFYERLEKAGRLRPYRARSGQQQAGHQRHTHADGLRRDGRRLSQSLSAADDGRKYRTADAQQDPPDGAAGVHRWLHAARRARDPGAALLQGHRSRRDLAHCLVPRHAAPAPARPSGVVGERLDHWAEHARLRQAALRCRKCGSGRNRAARRRCAQRARRVPRKPARVTLSFRQPDLRFP